MTDKAKPAWLKATPTWLKVAAPFLLLGAGTWCFLRSPWVTIWRLMETGARVRIAYTWSTVGLPMIALACFAFAIAISLTVKRRP